MYTQHIWMYTQHIWMYKHTDEQTNTHTDRHRPHPLLHQDHIQWAQLSSYDDSQLRSIYCRQLKIIQLINCHSMIPGMCPVVEEWWWEDYKECYMYYYKLRICYILDLSSASTNTLMDHKQMVIIGWLVQVQSIVTKGKFCRFNYQPSSLIVYWREYSLRYGFNYQPSSLIVYWREYSLRYG